MNFDHSEKVRDLIARLEVFMDEHIYPVEEERREFVFDPANLWTEWPAMAPLKAKAKAQGLWNLFLPRDYGEFSPGLSNLEYAPLAEIMGRVSWASEVFNCSPPDTGNMEVLARYGSPEQQEQWLRPLLAGEIRSCYVMTEPQVASSDATNLEMKTDFKAPRHKQHSTIIVPKDAPGVIMVRAQPVFSDLHSPGGECELRFDDVRVPKSNIILGEGRGFEIAQGRLGPGRIHHCMRSVGQAQRALELMAQRVESRVAFGKKLADQSSIRQDVARSFSEVEMLRLLTLKAADRMDKVGNKEAMDLIAAIKVMGPQMAQTVIDRAIQTYGGMGVSDDTPLAYLFTLNRYLRIADGPDEVHMSQLGKLKIKEYNAKSS